MPGQGEDRQPTVSHRWVHVLTLPLELCLTGGKLKQLRKQKAALSKRQCGE
ncbi:hypothetical protein [Geobacillus sp. TFV-3]|uniref:hypothetical protein n=1 Tax=Geobacillus sp. TFV-3 TaxID=1897059 RepID=UPI001F361905